MKYRIPFLVLVSLFSITTLGQGGKISGRITSADNKPIEGASVSLLKESDSSLVKLAITDKQGVYEFEKIKKGTYQVQCEAMGHQKTISKPIQIADALSSVQHKDLQCECANVRICGCANEVASRM